MTERYDWFDDPQQRLQEAELTEFERAEQERLRIVAQKRANERERKQRKKERQQRERERRAAGVKRIEVLDVVNDESWVMWLTREEVEELRDTLSDLLEVEPEVPWRVACPPSN